MKEIVITQNEAGQRLDKFLRKYLKDMSLGNIYKAIRKKEIKVNNLKSSEKYILNEGDVLQFYFHVGEETKKKEDKKIIKKIMDIEYDFDIAYEDSSILVVKKGKGVLTHPDEGDEATLTCQVIAYLYDNGVYDPEKEKTFSPSPCNRLDKNTEGLVIFAKNYEALKSINEAIREGNLKKYYMALTVGKPKEGRHIAHIQKDRRANKVRVFDDEVKNSKEIITDVKIIDTVGQFSQVEVDLITGKSHQIRAHLAHLDAPLVGDHKYGDKKINSFFKNRFGIEDQMLVAYKIIFKNCSEGIKHLEGKTISMQLPHYFKKIKNDVFKF
ncbi:RluA family pseudouridine synthase [Clostridium cylindrosporum]|uniref:RNA pseudouridylate synthase n=1 Tax=Clostridium cylindrosporum DSM 605 TaxID=1121307 RepID=A0A0J8DA58_CLOCY|nr:RluA family pseudouridine synthase [Clostridium cylindrosporum]KMT22737.1 23S RNA-specific pseudouridylate synthase [Clostridium cylindrosporum DSM 605]